MININSKYGNWIVGDKVFNKKIEALRHASITSQSVRFGYHDAVWQNFDRSLLGKVHLDLLYKERAQQLRDRYDYLILYFSGGADSNNVLHTFLKNNIKLDEICVKWPKKLIDPNNLYTPNQEDKSVRNYWSEWDYAVKPTLDRLKITHPDIKISIKEVIDSPDNLVVDSIFEKKNAFRAGHSTWAGVLSDSEIILLDKGKRIGHIYGVDKPILGMHGNKIYMFFTDIAVSMVTESEFDPDSTECFYWSPDFPLLPFEMAYQVSLHYKINKDLQKFLITKWRDSDRVFKTDVQDKIAKQIIYTTWDDRFQADKAITGDRSDKWFWFFEHSEFKKSLDRFRSNINNITAGINDRFLIKENDKVVNVRPIPSDPFFLTEFSNNE